MFLSVIIPIYNAEKYIDQCIDSILVQSYNNYEVILVDDGSTDNSYDICKNYARIDCRIKVIRKENGGSSSARNLGIKKAVGEYVLFLDADDYLCDDNCFQKMFNHINGNKFDFVLFKSLKGYIDRNKFVDYYGDYDLDVFKKGSRQVFTYMVKNNKQLACPWNRIINRELIINNKLFFREGIVGEDIDWTVRLFESAKKISAINEVFHVYRQDVATSVTHTKTVKKTWDLYNVIVFCVEYSKNNNLEYIYPFIAFEYAILLTDIATYENFWQFEQVRQYSYILNYALDKKTRLVKYAYKLFGFKNTMLLLRKVRK